MLSGGEQLKTLWMKVPSAMDISALVTEYPSATIKYHGTYAFLEFPTHQSARIALQGSKYEMNWARKHYSLFVGNLVHISEADLISLFKADQVQMFNGYAFVRFLSVEQQTLGLQMNTVNFKGCKLKVALATPKSKTTTVFIGGLNKRVTEPFLFYLFAGFGFIVSLSVISERNCGFVVYNNPDSAAAAIQHMNGFYVDGYCLLFRNVDYTMRMGKAAAYPS